jgi:predicted metal-dependent peptidase
MKQKVLSSQERITKNIEKWYLLEPLYFLVWTTHDAVVNPFIQTIRTGNGQIEYNPDFINSLTDELLNAVLKAEMTRILLKHPYTRKKDNAKAAYLASNITLKEYVETPLDFPSAAQTFGSKDFNRKHFELYYNKIMEQAQGQSDGQSSEKSSNKGGNSDKNKSSASSKSSDEGQGSGQAPPQYKNENDDQNDENGGENDQNGGNNGEKEQEPKGNQAPPNINQYTNEQSSGHENTEQWNDNEWMTSLINDKIEVAMQSQSWGNVPSYLKELIIASMRPKVDYRRILSAFRQSVLSSKRTLTRMKPSRRYGFQYMGSRRDFSTKLLFALDVSGSVPTRELQKGLSMLNQCFKYGVESIDVIQFDTNIKGEPLTVKKAKNSLQIAGRGGTDFTPVIQYIDQNKGYDGLIIFTDGYASRPQLPKNRSTRILWLFNDEANYNAMAYNVKGIGNSAFIK